MEIEKLLNQVVLHKTYGRGIIRNIEEKYFEVFFQEKNKVSKFIYPSCFYGFLTLEDIHLQLEIETVVADWKKETGVAEKEELQKQYEKTVEGIKARRKAAEEKKIRAAQKSMLHRLNAQ